MSTQTLPTIADLTQAIAQTEAEIATLQPRLATLRKPSTPPPADATPDEIIAASLATAQAQATAAPEASGVELAIARLQARLSEQRAALALAVAADSRAAHEAKAASAQAELRQLAAELAAKMADTRVLIEQIKAVANDGDSSYRALQSPPQAPGDGAGYANWQPAGLCNFTQHYELPRLIERKDGGFGLGTESLDLFAAEAEARREKELTQRIRNLR